MAIAAFFLINSSMNARKIATYSLLAVVLLFIFSLCMVEACGGWGWEALLAFSEAATVGALADWFAVVALFRHPLGVPIPHTAVLVKKQASIAKSISSFFCDNFWIPQEIHAKVMNAAPTTYLMRLLSEQPKNINNVKFLLKQRLEMFFNSTQNCNRLADVLEETLPTLPLKKGVYGVLRGVSSSDLPRKATDIFVKEAANYARDNKELLAREAASCITPKIVNQMPLMGALISDGIESIIGQLAAGRITAYLTEVAADVHHPLRLQLQRCIEQNLVDIASGSKYDTEIDESLSALTRSVNISKLLQKLPRLLNQDEDTEDNGKLLHQLKNALECRPDLTLTIDSALADLAAALVNGTRELVARELETTICAWDMGSMVSKIEEHVGSDLQYIRLNGTFVGGLIGLLIYGITCLVQCFI